MRLLPLLHYSSFLVYTSLIIFIIYKNPKELLNRVCAGLLACFAIWSFGAGFLHDILVSRQTVALAMNLYSIGWCSFSSFLLWFSAVLTKRHRLLRSKIFHMLISVLPVLFICMQWRGLLINEYLMQPYGWSYRWSHTIWPNIFYAYYGLFLAASLFLCLDFQEQPGVTRREKHITTIIIATSICFVFGSISNVLLPQLDIHRFPAIADIIILIWAASLSFTMARYGLMVITPQGAAPNILATIPDSLILVNSRQKIIAVNKATSELLGYREEELLGKSINMFYPEGDSFSVSSIEKTGNYPVSVKNHETVYYSKFGLIVPVSLSVSPVIDRWGDLTGMIYAAKDITDIKRTELELQESEERYRAIFENTGTAMIIVEEDTTISLVNRQFEILCGYSKKEVENKKRWTDFVAQDDLERMISYHYKRRNTDENVPTQYEFCLVDKKGRIKNIALSMSIIAKTKSIASLSDITERKRIEEALWESEQFSSTLLDNSPNPILVINPDMCIKYVNPALEELTGFAAIELIGNKTPYPWWIEERAQKLRAILADTSEKDRVTIEEVFKTKSGRRFWVTITYKIIRKNRKVQYYLAYWVDMTAQKKAKYDLERAYANLQKTQAQLIQAEKLEVVGRLASGAAHEVKNPLAIIMQWSDFLKKKIKTKDKNLSLALRNIDTAINRADNIIKGLLDFSSLSTVHIQREPLNSILEAALGLVEHHFSAQHIKLTKRLEAGLPDVAVDRNRIEQVFINLFLNAIQAMPEGGTLSVRTRVFKNLGRKRSKIAVEIEDSGKGIPENILPKIFDPFFTTKQKEKGTGLGLSIVNNILKLHHAAIAVNNKKNNSGVRVIVTFDKPEEESNDKKDIDHR